MAIIDANAWAAGTGLALSGADAASVATFCCEVSEILAAQLYPILVEPLTLTLSPFDAPVAAELILPRPIRSITAIHLVPGANGDPSQCNASNLLVNFADYFSKTDVLSGTNKTGIVLRRSSSIWGVEWRRPPGKLGASADPNRGAVFVSGDFGYASVPGAVVNAARTAVTLMYNSRTSGVPANSESWANYSVSYASQHTASSAVNSPAVQEILRSAGFAPIHIG